MVREEKKFSSAPRSLVTLWTALALQMCLCSQQCHKGSILWLEAGPSDSASGRQTCRRTGKHEFPSQGEPTELFSSRQTGHAADLYAFAACWAFGCWRLGDKLENFFSALFNILNCQVIILPTCLLKLVLGSSPAFLCVPFGFLTSLYLKLEETEGHADASVGSTPHPVRWGQGWLKPNLQAKIPHRFRNQLSGCATEGFKRWGRK